MFTAAFSREEKIHPNGNLMDFLMICASNDTIIIYNINDMYSVDVGLEQSFDYFLLKKKCLETFTVCTAVCI